MTPVSPQVAQGSVVTRFEIVDCEVLSLLAARVTQGSCIADLICGTRDLPCRVSAGQSTAGGSWCMLATVLFLGLHRDRCQVTVYL